MVTHFRERLKDKSKKELEHIVFYHSSYQEETVKTAIELLKEQYKVSLPLNYYNGKLTPRRQDANTFQSYFKTFSKREVLSAFVSASVYYAILVLLEYLSSSAWVAEYSFELKFSALVLVFALNHIFYKQEHKRRNLFMGKITQNGLTLMFLVLAIEFHALLLGATGMLKEAGLFILLLRMVFVLFVVESIVAIIRRFLILCKWHIW